MAVRIFTDHHSFGWTVGENNHTVSAIVDREVIMRLWLIGAIAAGWLALVPSGAVAQSGVFIGATSSDREAAALEAWFTETRDTLGSAEFAENLRRLAPLYPQIYLRHENGAPRIAGMDVIQDALNGRNGHRWVRSNLALGYGTNVFEPSAGWIGLTEADGSQLGSISIPRGNLARWYSEAGDIVERSCAVNTMAHEISHTIAGPEHPIQFWIAFADVNRRLAPAGVPAASYLVGTVAQCTWLQRKGRITADDVSACVAVFGTRHFNDKRCTSFAGDSAIVEGPDLPAAAKDED